MLFHSSPLEAATRYNAKTWDGWYRSDVGCCEDKRGSFHFTNASCRSISSLLSSSILGFIPLLVSVYICTCSRNRRTGLTAKKKVVKNRNSERSSEKWCNIVTDSMHAYLSPLWVMSLLQVSICTSSPLFILHISMYSCKWRFMSDFAVANSNCRKTDCITQSWWDILYTIVTYILRSQNQIT